MNGRRPVQGGIGLRVDQRCARLEERLAEIELWRDRAHVDLPEWRFDGEPLALLGPWPRRDDVHMLEASGAIVPAEWPLAETRLDLDVGGEALLEIHYADGRSRRYGLDLYHHRFPVEAAGFDLTVRAVARRPFGQPNRDPRLARARVVWLDAVVDDLSLHLRLILEAARAMPTDEAVDPLLSCAERALARVQWPSATADYVAHWMSSPRFLDLWQVPPGLDTCPSGLPADDRLAVGEALAQLRAELQSMQRRYPPRGMLTVTGLAHLDLAWLWPLDETRRKAQRTFWTAVNLMSAYPEFTFNQSAAQLYAFVEEDDPELFGEVTRQVANGAWEPIGGMWVETDANLPSGESLVRQLLYGQRYFQRAFGAHHRIAWLPDTFGFSPALPQLLAAGGIDALFAQKLNRAETNRFPYDLYWWEGLDGSRLLVHAFDNPHNAYDAVLGPEPMVRTWENYGAKHVHPESLLSIGYGDGGGGPTVEMVERVRALDVFPALPGVRFGRVDDFFDRARRTVAAGELPVWVGELYFELHRGTFTTQGRLKRLHRQAERDLVAAEVLGAIDALAGGDRPSTLEAQWRVLLRNEFHDILPGSSITEVNATAEAELAGVVAEAGAEIERCLGALARRVAVEAGGPGLLVVNPDLAGRPLRVELAGDARIPGMQAIECGAVVASDQRVAGLEALVLVDPVPVAGLECSRAHLENEHVRVDLDGTGALASVFDKAYGREVLAGRGNQLWAYVDKPRIFDAWDIDVGHTDEGIEVTSTESVQAVDVVESGPHRAAIRIVRRFRASTIVQEVRLWSNSPRVEFRTILDWHDRRWLLKARFPLAVRAAHAVFETAFGVIERPTHRNTSWDAARFEVPAHRFVDLSEAGYGVALLNNGRYGHHAVGNELGISLLRSPLHPDPLADEGHHEFVYTLYPRTAGRWHEAAVLSEAEDLNRPLLARPVNVGGGTPTQRLQPVRVGGLPLGLGALKVAEDREGYVLRCYEPLGGRGAADVELPPGWQLERQLDLLERDTGPVDCTFTPFAVRSWLLTRRS